MKNWIYIITTAALLLVSCGGEKEAPDMDYLCTAQKNMTPFCGLQSPEDMEWLPDGSGMIVSEYGASGATQGKISLINHLTGEVTVLHDPNTPRRSDGELWGDSGCEGQSKLSPHGISLSQRSDGRWQLLVVNHAETESIDFFELMLKDSTSWSLQWRGCVLADDDSLLNDVTATGDGFFTTRFYQKGSPYNSMWDYYFGRKNGHVKKWTPSQGWSILEGTTGVLLNGVLYNEKLDELVVCEWGKERVNVFNSEGEKKYSVEVPFPDNVSWNANRDGYLIPGKKSSFMKIVNCTLDAVEVCQGPFQVYEVTPSSQSVAVKYSNEGQFFSAPSNVIERDGKFYVGSFLGTRMLVAE